MWLLDIFLVLSSLASKTRTQPSQQFALTRDFLQEKHLKSAIIFDCHLNKEGELMKKGITFIISD